MTTIGKNTVVGVSVGTLIAAIFAIWMVSGLGRPLFASDLVVIEHSIEKLDKKTSIAILNLAKQNLQSELRKTVREFRLDPNNGDIEDDIAVIEDDIKEIDTKIDCYRRKDCDMEEDV